MLIKTRGIVLQTIKHSDSGVISHIFTEEYGLQSFIVKGIHSKKSNTRKAYFQPLQILNLEVYYKASRNLQSLKEVSTDISLSTIPYEFDRNSIAFFIGEVLKKTLNEEEANQDLFDFVRDSIIILDSEKNVINFHIGFLIGLARYLGISPSREFSETNCFFDMQNGIFISSPPLHGYYLDRKLSELLNRFSNSSIKDCNNIPLTGAIRSSFLDNILTYYGMHLQGLNKIKSLEVLKEMFKQ